VTLPIYTVSGDNNQPPVYGTDSLPSEEPPPYMEERPPVSLEEDPPPLYEVICSAIDTQVMWFPMWHETHTTTTVWLKSCETLCNLLYNLYLNTIILIWDSPFQDLVNQRAAVFTRTFRLEGDTMGR